METLNVTLAENQGATTENVLEVELKPFVETPESKAHRASIFVTMQSIHRSIAKKINDEREARWKGFFRPQDRYIPDNPNEDFAALEAATNLNDNAPLPKSEDTTGTDQASPMPILSVA